MGVTKEDVEATTTAALNPSHLVVIDTSGVCGASYEIEVVSEQFEIAHGPHPHRVHQEGLTQARAQAHPSAQKAQD